MFATRTYSFGKSPYGISGSNEPVQHVERSEPEHHRNNRRREQPGGCAPLPPQAQTQCRKDGRQQNHELGVQPRKDRKSSTAPQPGSLPRRKRRVQPERSPGHQECGGHLRKNQPAVRNKRHCETDSGPGEPRDAGASQQRRQIEDRQCRERARQAQHRNRTQVSRNGVRRHQQRGQAWRVYRVDDFVQTAPREVRAQIAAKVLAIVAAHVIVLDRQIVVAKKTLRNHEVVRLVRARADSLCGPQTEAKSTPRSSRRRSFRDPATG